jgi:hypothetical protein
VEARLSDEETRAASTDLVRGGSPSVS